MTSAGNQLRRVRDTNDRPCSTWSAVAATACRAAGISVAAFTDPHARAEQSAAKALATFGLFGIWAPDCTRLVSSDSFRTAYAEEAGGRSMHAFSTDGRTNFFKEEVGGARQLRPDLLEIVPLRDGRPVAVARLLRELDTVRVVHAEAPDGRSFVLDEVIVVNEKPSPALHRCSDAESLRMIEALSTGL